MATLAPWVTVPPQLDLHNANRSPLSAMNLYLPIGVTTLTVH